MTNKKNTRRALLMSVMSLILCLVMLTGTTFAWFTDEVTSGNNIIKSGTLEVAMDWAEGNVAPDAAEWKDASQSAIFNYDLWEPGYTDAKYIRIANKGNLALNWNLAIVANGTATELADVIDVYYTDEATLVENRDLSGFTYAGPLSAVASGFGNGVLEAGKNGEATYQAVTIVLKMRESAGNEYQNKSVGTDFSVKLYATQATVETDSFGNDYDKDAHIPVHATPADIQDVIRAAQPGDTIVLETGAYGNLVIENADGSPKKGITIVSATANPGNNPTSAPDHIGFIDLNGSEDITIRGFYFDMEKAQPVYKKDSTATGYVASIVGSGAGVNVGAKNIVIENCKFAATSSGHDDYVAICFEEQGKPTSRATNITVRGCMLDKSAFNFVRANYLSEGTVTIQGNTLYGGTVHSALNFTGNAADLLIKNNTFGFTSASGTLLNKGWNPEKAMLGTSRQGSNHITIEVTGNTFKNQALVEGEGHVIELKSSYTPENCTLVFEDNTFAAGLAEMKEYSVPCIWHE